MIDFFLPLLTLLGLLTGSFLNVVIYRLPPKVLQNWEEGIPASVDNQSPLDCLVDPPRSLTPCCSKEIRWYDNVPVLSWLLLAGQCRYCGSNISWRYPLVELLTASLFLYAGYRWGISPVTYFYCVFFALLVAMFFIDLDNFLLPDVLTLPLIWIGLIGAAEVHLPLRASDAIFGAIAGYGILFCANALYRVWRKRDGFGGGDLKLLAGFGAWLGATSIIPILTIAAIVGLLSIGVHTVMAKDKLTAETAVPFGPFLITAAVAYLIVVG